jgi:molecular chaperone GrpE
MVKQDKDKKETPVEEKETMADVPSSQTGNPDITAEQTQQDGTGTDVPENKATQEVAEQSVEKPDEKDIMIKNLQEKNNELNDKYLRLFSEFDNFRKRSLKEKLELTKTASADIIEAILPVMDDLERAYKSAIENPDSDALLEGLNLIQVKMKTTLKHKGLEEIPSVGELFNTDFHEAITHAPAQDEKDKGKVLEEVQKGYLLNGKVLRFAKVVVAN